MEWILWIAIAFGGFLLIAYLFGGSSDSIQNKPSSSKSRGLKVSDYVPKQKNDDGIYCSPEIAHECIKIFSENLGAHDEAFNLYISEFNKLISEAEESLKQDRENNDDDVDIKKCEAEIKNVEGDTDFDDEDKKEEIKKLSDEIADMKKVHKKVEKWIDANELKLRQDCRKQLRAVLTAANSAWKDDPLDYHHLEINCEPPELPSSPGYY